MAVGVGPEIGRARVDRDRGECVSTCAGGYRAAKQSSPTERHMIITRTPLRISLGGGGTDLASYYEQHGGFVVAASIAKYVYIGINATFTHDYFLKYSSLERADDVHEIDHPIIRVALTRHDGPPAFEILGLSDVPSATGLWHLV